MDADPITTPDATTDQLVWLSENYATILHPHRDNNDHYQEFFDWLDDHTRETAYQHNLNLDDPGANVAHSNLLAMVQANLLTEEFLDEALARMVLSGLHRREGLT